MAPSMEAKAGSEIPKGSAALDRLRDDIRTLYGPGGELSKLDSPGTAAEALLPKLVLEGDKVRRFGRNGIITHRDGTREVFHQGRRFIVNKNGTIQGDRPGSVVKGMWFDAADNTIRFKQGDVRITYNPEEDKTSISNGKGDIEINSKGVLYYDRESRKYKKFRALDGSFSITMDEKGVASIVKELKFRRGDSLLHLLKSGQEASRGADNERRLIDFCEFRAIVRCKRSKTDSDRRVCRSQHGGGD